jgi:hypothetical protein
MMTKPDFWEGGEAAQKILKERTSLLESLSPWEDEKKVLEEAEILLQLVEEQQDEKPRSWRRSCGEVKKPSNK